MTKTMPAGEPPAVDPRLVLLVVDPLRAHAYWELPARAVEAARGRLGDAAAQIVLRVYDVTGGSRGESCDVDIGEAQGNYYLDLLSPGRELTAEVGVRSSDGRFSAICRANVISLPAAGESEIYEERRRQVRGPGDPLWKSRATASPPRAGAGRRPPRTPAVAEAAVDVSMTAGKPTSGPPESSEPVVAAAAKVFAASDVVAAETTREARASPRAPGQAEPSRPPAAPRGADAALSTADEEWVPSGYSASSFLSSDALSSWALSSVRRGASGTPSDPHSTALEVHAELVVFGRAEPGAEIVIDGVPVTASADGTFEKRIPLPSKLRPG